MREDLCSQLPPAGRATLRRGVAVAVAMVGGLLQTTTRNDLADLEAGGYLLRGKRGRQFVWSPAPHLRQRLSSAQ